MSSRINAALFAMRERMDAFIVGQEPVKEALLLALIAREHVYLEGEPGCAKTLLAEVAGNTAHLRFYFSQLHRDTRLTDLIGAVVLRREQLPGGAEVIRQTLQPGGVLDAEIVLLDDISRAPGEALNVLLRVLNERKYQSLSIPLMTAIATSNPTDSDYYNEPLDPANLDRFTLQLRASGAVNRREWKQARQIMDRYEGFPAELSAGNEVPAELLHEAFEAHRRVVLPPAVSEAYRRFLDNLVNKHGCTPENSLLTDRTMLVKVPRMIKAMALLRGRDRATLEDLHVLKYILTFRVPEHLYENLEQLLDQVIEEVEQDEELMSQDSEEQQQAVRGDEESDPEGEDAQQQDGGGDQDLVDQLLEAMQANGDESEKRKAMQQQAASPDDGQGQVTRSAPQQVENLDVLLDKIRGRLERNQADSESHPGGSPRTYRHMRSFDEFTDTDPAETAIWMSRINPNLPRAFHRKKKNIGGKVVIVRDVSQSMEGRYARWTSSVVTRIVDMVRKKRMRIGYIEFNHVSRKYTHDGHFFTRDYDRLVEKAGNVSCSGVTNYQYPLRDALAELRKGGGPNKHILFLTDGEPTQGDWLVREERKQAKAQGVAIHTLFIGTTECPEILDILSHESDGSQFLATPDERGGLLIAERPPRAPQPPPGQHGFPVSPPGGAAAMRNKQSPWKS